MSTAIAEITPERFPNLVFNEGAREQLEEINSFLTRLASSAPATAAGVREELEQRLDYLNAFGGIVSEVDRRPRFRVNLGRDFAPLSFTLVWKRLVLESGEYVSAMNGGLIWHGGSNDPLCVTLTPQLWGIHT